MLRAALASALMCALSASAQSQDATPPESTLEQAERALAAERFDEARRLFEQIDRLMPDARARAGLGLVALGEGEVVDAYTFLTQALAEQNDPLVGEARARARQGLRRATAAVGRVRLTPPPRPDAYVRFGGEEPFLVDGVIVVEPGRYFLVVHVSGFEPDQRSIDVRAGRETRVRVTLRREVPSRQTGAVASWIGGSPPPDTDYPTDRGFDLRLRSQPVPTVTVRIRPPTVVGRLELPQAGRAIHANMDGFRECVRRSHVREDTLVTIQLSVDAHGLTNGVRVGSTATDDASLEACLTQVVERMRFPAEQSRAPVRVSFELTLDYLFY